MPEKQVAEDAIKVFISYSWDSKEHKDKVYHLAQALRDDGIDCTIDQFVQSPDNWDRWMLDQIDESDFVLIVCTERYYRRYRGKEKVNKGLGVTWESTLIMGRLHDSQGRNPKFYPIFFDTPNIAIIPDGIRTSYFDLSGYDLFNLDNNEQRLKEDGGYQDLYRLLTNQPYVTPKKIGSLKKLKTIDRETEQLPTEKEAEAQAERERQRQAELLKQQEAEAAERQRQQTAQTQLASEKGVDYTRLRDLLKAGKWKEADQETADRMCEVMGRQAKGWLRVEDIQNFPCTDLRTIDHLWVTHSQGKFGFSVQKKIWQECGSPTQYNSHWEKFGEAVGWMKHFEWSGLDHISAKSLSLKKYTSCISKSYSELTFDISAPNGHIPYCVFLRLSSVLGVGFVGRDRVGALGFSSLAQRLVDCNCNDTRGYSH
ncbi:GUN4 domain-containing protein [Leptodesmis sichuanensis]|uniref:GUN4 domain-containing protein n=1 Tax=Leptodesmis sichuanensis TaxID=2906798 RepID=UPI001F246ED6|nr:GUN4 domain-containing protein [Leptodesmis sichuanensis]UIE39464.1 GUN4 domain-containing protein [Leptodesmis sichuanensis A121]